MLSLCLGPASSLALSALSVLGCVAIAAVYFFFIGARQDDVARWVLFVVVIVLFFLVNVFGGKWGGFVDGVVLDEMKKLETKVTSRIFSMVYGRYLLLKCKFRTGPSGGSRCDDFNGHKVILTGVSVKL